jgi:hypothetical protein
MMYYFSGVDRAAFIELLAREEAGGMVNAQIATQPAMIAAYERWPGVPLVLDSGAFQGVTDIDWYAEVMSQIGDRFEWCANLDVIGDQSASDRNWMTLKERDVSPLWVYQVQGGRDLKYLASVADVHRFIGVGGLVPLIKSNVSKALRLIEEVGRVLTRLRAQAHFFGVGSPMILAEFAGEEWFASADSQSWLCGFKARELITRDGRRVKTNGPGLGLALLPEECAAQNIRQINAWLSGKPVQFSLFNGGR